MREDRRKKKREREKKEKEGEGEGGDFVKMCLLEMWELKKKRMVKTVRERRGKEECCHVITVDPKTNLNWNVHCPEMMEM